MSFQRVITNGASGGISANTKTGFPDSYRFSRNLNIHDDGDSITLNPRSVKDSGSVVTDLVKWMVGGDPFDTNKYALGNTGNFYKITSGGSWSLVGTVSSSVDGCHGNGLVCFKDFVYIVNDSNVSVYGPLSGTPALTNNYFEGLSLDKDSAANLTATGQTYTLGTSIVESDTTKKLTFTPGYDPLYKIQVNVNDPGTGNWTFTVHDTYNNKVGSVTYIFGTFGTGVSTFVFTAPYVKVTPGQSYHVHITSTVADGKVVTSVASDLSTAYYQNYFKVLHYDTNYHPTTVHTDGTKGIVVFGNNNYLSTWDGGTYNPNKITLEPGYITRCFMFDSIYLLALCWRGSAIDGYDEGKYFIWDGITSYYNDKKPITGGLPNAATNFKGRVLSVLGSVGDINLGSEPFKKIAPMPKLTFGKKVEVAPGAIDVWRSKAVIGYSISTDDASIEQGVYEYGSQTDRALSYTDVSTETLNFGYTISTGTTKSTSVQIGCVKSFGKDLYVGWYDGTQGGGSQYGVDKISKTGLAAATGSWESLIEDKSVNGKNIVPMPQKEKSALRVVIEFLPLPTGCTVSAKYKMERATTGGVNNDGWTLGTASTAGSTSAEVTVNGLGSGRYKEIEYGFDCTSSSGNYLFITAIYFEFDALEEERGDN